MTDRSKKLSVTIKRTAHGKPYIDVAGLGVDDQGFPLHDALDFPGNRGRDDLEAALKDRCPGIEVSYSETRLDFIAEIRSIDREVDRDEFMDHWRIQLRYAQAHRFRNIDDPFRRIVPVRLSGKDRVRWWSGWFHYPLLIEDSRRQMKESGERLAKFLERTRFNERDVIEEAYYEQVMRERLAIFERRREAWRIARWGATTALGLVLACWSGIQIWDRFFGC